MIEAGSNTSRNRPARSSGRGPGNISPSDEGVPLTINLSGIANGRLLALAATLTLTSAIIPPPPAAASPPPMTICGWISNPTPANWTLNDRAGRWVVGTQGGHQARGLATRMPDFNRAPSHWVRQNVGSYGYGCACLVVEADRRQMRVNRLISVRQQPLSICRADRNLPPF